MSVFNGGTVTVTNGSTSVTGTGTGFGVNAVAGGRISISGIVGDGVIASVESQTSLTLALPWAGASASDADYVIDMGVSGSREATRAALILAQYRDALQAVSDFMQTVVSKTDAEGALQALGAYPKEEVNSLLDKKLSTSGGDVTGPIQASFAAAEFRVDYPNVATWQTPVVLDDGSLAFYCIGTKKQALTITTDGRLQTDRMGNVEDYIANRVAKAGDTMTGVLLMNYAKAELRLNYPNVGQWQTPVVRDDGSIGFYSFNNQVDALTVFPDGRLSTAQFGDLNQRIEDRALAYSRDRVKNLQYRTVGEGYANSAAEGTNYQSPDGAFIFGVQWGASNGSGRQVNGVFYRYLQVFDEYRGWVGVSRQ